MTGPQVRPTRFGQDSFFWEVTLLTDVGDGPRCREARLPMPPVAGLDLYVDGKFMRVESVLVHVARERIDVVVDVMTVGELGPEWKDPEDGSDKATRTDDPTADDGDGD